MSAAVQPILTKFGTMMHFDLLHRSDRYFNKNSSGDEIANVNFFTTMSHTYFKTPKREPISFNKLDDS